MQICKNCFHQLRDGDYCGYCGYNNRDRQEEKGMALRPFTTLCSGRYIVGRVLGMGGFGITYAAADRLSGGSRIAIKEYFPSSIAKRDAVTQKLLPGSRAKEYEAGLKSFEKEARTLALLRGGRAQSAVQVYEFFFENGTGYMAMEYIDGPNLKEMAREYGGLIPYDVAYYILTELIKALRIVHSEGVLHRDISPDNVIMQPDGKLRLIDFGAARTELHSGLTGQMIMLRPGFAPPEQYSDTGDQGPWTDLYALACTFYRLVSGRALPDARQRLQGEQVIPLYSLMPGIVPINVSAAIEKAMSLDTRVRYRSMSEFLAAIADYNKQKSTIKVGGEEPGDEDDDVGIVGRLIENIRSVFSSPVVTVAETGEAKRLHKGRALLIGRSENCDLVTMKDRHIGRIHCRVFLDEDEQLVKVECTSVNGIQLANGRTIQKGETAALRDKVNILRLANTESRIKVVYP